MTTPARRRPALLAAGLVLIVAGCATSPAESTPDTTGLRPMSTGTELPDRDSGATTTSTTEANNPFAPPAAPSVPPQEAEEPLPEIEDLDPLIDDVDGLLDELDGLLTETESALEAEEGAIQ